MWGKLCFDCKFRLCDQQKNLNLNLKKSRDFRVSSSSDVQEPHDPGGKPLHFSALLTSGAVLVSTCPMYGLGLVWIQGPHRKAMSQFWAWLITRCVHGKGGGEEKQSTVFPTISPGLSSSVGKTFKSAIFKGWRYLVIMFSEEGR